jgi:hypothetical protein
MFLKATARACSDLSPTIELGSLSLNLSRNTTNRQEFILQTRWVIWVMLVTIYRHFLSWRASRLQQAMLEKSLRR